MERTKAKYDLPKRVLLLLLVTFVVIIFAAAIKINEVMIVAIPIIVLIGVLFIKTPEIGFSVFLVGQNILVVPFMILNIDKVMLIYPLMSIILILTFGLTLLYKRFDAPHRFSSIQLFVFLIALIFLFNIPRSEITTYTISKTILFISVCIIPFIVLHFWGYKTDFFEKSIDYAIILGIIPIMVSFIMLIRSGYSSQYARFNALDINVNQYARNMGFISILAFYKIFKTNKNIYKLLLILFIAISLLFIILTGSRSAFLASLAAIFFYLFAYTNIKTSKKIIVLIVLLIPILIFAIMGIGSMFNRLGSLQYVDMSLTGRVGMWQAVWEQKFDKIIFGHGTGNYSEVLPAWAKAANLSHLHNVIIEYYVEWGLVGLMCYLLLLASCFKICYEFIKKKRKDTVHFNKLGGLSTVLFVYTLLLAMVVTSSTDHLFFISIGLMSSIYIAHKEKDAYRDGSIGSSA